MAPDKVELKYGPVVLECVSRSEPTREPYRVRFLDGHYSCNCKGWIFSKDRRPNGDRCCKHTIAAERLEITTESKGRTFNTDPWDEQAYAGFKTILNRPQTTAPAPVNRPSVLLASLLGCLGPLRSRVTVGMQNEMQKILDSNVPARKSGPVFVASNQPRRIVFDD